MCGVLIHRSLIRLFYVEEVGTPFRHAIDVLKLVPFLASMKPDWSHEFAEEKEGEL